MSEATQKVRDFLTKSPSVVYPDDVLGLFEQVERENTKLRELVKALVAVADLMDCDKCPCQHTPACVECDESLPMLLMRELGIEVGE